MNVVLFSRGRGNGHAVRDLALVDALAPLLPEMRLNFVSYSTGASVFRRAGRECIDLNLPADTRFVDTLVLAHEVLERHEPDLVISHEEFSAVVAAKIHRRPCIYLSSWLPPPGSVGADALKCADVIYVLSDRNIFPPLVDLNQSPRFVGPLIRELRANGEKSEDRRRMGIGDDTFVVAVVPGGWASEARSPIYSLVSAAFDRLAVPDRRLIWLAGDDCENIRAASQGRSDVTVFPYVDEVEAILTASDLVVTKGNRGATLEAEELGIPSISISFGTNRMDDMLIRSVASNVGLRAEGLTAEILSGHFRRVLQKEAPAASGRRGTANRRRREIAQSIADEIRRRSAR